MAKIGFVTDSTADFPHGLDKQNNIHIMPVHVVVDSKDYLDGKEISNEQVIEKMKNNHHVFTRPAAPAEYADFYEKLLEKYDYILSFQVASNLSECFQSAKSSLNLLPPESSKKIKIIDTRSTSIGQGMYVLKAIETIKKDKTVEDLENKVNLIMGTNINNFTVDSLIWLKKSGKIGTLGAAFGNMLDIKPLIVLKDSQLKPLGNIRGKKNVLNEMASYAGKTKKKTGFDYDVWVAHCDAVDDAKYLCEKLAANLGMDEKEIRIAKAGAAISVQTGPGSIAWGMVKK
ncbi:MAG: DegV family protein [Desulfobacteraceae bacterium]